MLAQNERTGEIAAKRVLGLIRPENKALYLLRFVDMHGREGTFSATDDHPWKVESKGWVKTQHLAASDRIDTQSGNDIIVHSVIPTERRARTYNLTVADWQAFIVGRSGAIVHNADCYTHGYAYDPRVRKRGVEDPSSHNFPYSFDDHILSQPPVMQTDGSLLYRLPGYLRGNSGIYEIALNRLGA